MLNKANVKSTRRSVQSESSTNLLSATAVGTDGRGQIQTIESLLF